MNDETFNHSLRKFLKTVGVGSQTEIEKAVGQALAERRVAGNEQLPATMTLEIPGIGLKVSFAGRIDLE